MNPEDQLQEATEELRGRATAMQAQVSANDLANPPAPVRPPEPRINTNDGSRTRGLIDNVANGTQNFIASQSEEAQRAKELGNLLGEQTFDAAGQRSELNQQFGLPDNLSRLGDIQTQLARANTDSSITQSRIASADGQTLGQAGREITQEDRESAIRNAGLAAEASVLQGNIETASTLVSQAMSDYYQDRQLKNQNMIQQLNYFSGIADKQTSQLLQQEQRKYEEDQAKVERVQTAVDAALQSGAAGAGEIAFLTNPKTTDDERLAMSQLVQARGAGEVRDLEMSNARTSLAIKAKQLANLRNPVVATRDTSVIEVGGEKQLVDTQTGEVIATFGADVSNDAILQARDTNFVNTLDGLKTHPGLNTSVGPTGLTRIAGVDAFGNKDDFVSSIENVLRTLTLNTFAEAKEKGMTFGAMSQGEWDILSQSATKIAETRIYDKEGLPGFRKTTAKVKGYDLAESDFLSEMDKLSNFAKMDALRKGVNASDIGVSQTDDGKFWAQNSDGSYTELFINPQ